MHNSTYHKVNSVADAVAKAGGEAAYLSGGMTLIPTMKARLAEPSDLIDVSGVAEMQGITVSDAGVTIGAAVTHAEVAASTDVQAAIPALACLAAGIGDPAVRHRGTIGGSVANNDPAADYPAACLGLGATIVTNSRKIAADDFFVGMFETALDEGEIITAITFPKAEAAGYAKFPNPASRYAMVGVMAVKTASGARVAVTGAGSDGVFRASDMEAALNGTWDAAALDGIRVDAGDMMSDIHASAEYRAHLVSVMAKRALGG